MTETEKVMCSPCLEDASRLQEAKNEVTGECLCHQHASKEQDATDKVSDEILCTPWACIEREQTGHDTCRSQSYELVAHPHERANETFTMRLTHM